MDGVRTDRPITYHTASLRIFAPRERYVQRVCPEDVLLLVTDGVLRFREDGTDYEIRPGEYHIHRHGTAQSGPLPSDEPRYLYVHLTGEWGAAEDGNVVPQDGAFDPAALWPLMAQVDALAHGGAPYLALLSAVCTLLLRLVPVTADEPPVAQIARYLDGAVGRPVTIGELAERFRFSPGHLIVLFRRAYGVTPIAYLERRRLQEAARLLEVTSDPIGEIAARCGYATYSHFFRSFCRAYGLSPEAWRQARRIGG